MDSAEEQAEAAAAASRVVVRPLTDPAELAAMCRLLDEVWGPVAEPIVSRELALVLSRSGSYVAGAYDGPRLVAASVGILSADPNGLSSVLSVGLHSHVTAVRADVRDRRVGFALKQHQRAWALARGLSSITWTFDPLVRRNAHLNLARLGAHAVAYVEDYYGPLDDAVNRGDLTDRLVVRWDLTAGTGETGRSAEPIPLGFPTAVEVSASGWPLQRVVVVGAPQVLVALPEDITALRRTDPAAAVAWRHAVRAQLGGRMSEGWRLAGLVGRSHYLLTDERGRPA